MGKIRVKTLGIEELEKEQVKDAKKRKESKQAKSASRRMAKGAHGGERVVSMAPTEEELANIEVPKVTLESEAPQVEKKEKGTKSKKKAGKSRQRSKRYRDALIAVDKNRAYPLSEAVTLVKKLGPTKFDATVELHINTIEKGISGQLTLPHGTGKTTRVAIADVSAEDSSEGGSFESLLKKIESGKIDFDVLIATPAAMARLGKVARILGPRGLMPNPKNGTITDSPKKIAATFAKGALNFKTESQAPIIHATVGKQSFSEKDLSDNIEAFLKSVSSSKIKSVTLKSTMSPGIRLDFATAA